MVLSIDYHPLYGFPTIQVPFVYHLLTLLNNGVRALRDTLIIKADILSVIRSKTLSSEKGENSVHEVLHKLWWCLISKGEKKGRRSGKKEMENSRGALTFSGPERKASLSFHPLFKCGFRPYFCFWEVWKVQRKNGRKQALWFWAPNPFEKAWKMWEFWECKERKRRRYPMTQRELGEEGTWINSSPPTLSYESIKSPQPHKALAMLGRTNNRTMVEPPTLLLYWSARSTACTGNSELLPRRTGFTTKDGMMEISVRHNFKVLFYRIIFAWLVNHWLDNIRSALLNNSLYSHKREQKCVKGSLWHRPITIWVNTKLLSIKWAVKCFLHHFSVRLLLGGLAR